MCAFRGQTAVEYLLILSAVVVIATVVIVTVFDVVGPGIDTAKKEKWDYFCCEIGTDTLDCLCYRGKTGSGRTCQSLGTDGEYGQYLPHRCRCQEIGY